MTADSTAGQQNSLPPDFARQAARPAAGRRDEGSLVAGVDLGTVSARAVVVWASDGAELGTGVGTGVGEYSHGAIERATLHDYFAGRPEWAGNDVLHRLRNRRNGANPG